MSGPLWLAPLRVALLPLVAIALQWALPWLQWALMVHLGGAPESARAYAFTLLPISLVLSSAVVWLVRGLYGHHHRFVLLVLALQAAAMAVRPVHDRWDSADSHLDLGLFFFAGQGVFALVYLLCVAWGGGLREVRRTSAAIRAHLGLSQQQGASGWIRGAKLLALASLACLGALFIASDANARVEMLCHFFVYYLFLLVLPLAPLVAHHRVTMRQAKRAGQATAGGVLGMAAALVAFCLLSAPAVFYAFIARL